MSSRFCLYLLNIYHFTYTFSHAHTEAHTHKHACTISTQEEWQQPGTGAWLRGPEEGFVRDLVHPHKKIVSKTPIFTNLKKRFEHIELPAKLLDHFLRSNKSNTNQFKKWYSKEEVIFRNDAPFSFLKRLPCSCLKRLRGFPLHFWRGFPLHLFHDSSLPGTLSDCACETSDSVSTLTYDDGNVLWTEDVYWNHVVWLTVGCLVRLRDGLMCTLHWKCNTVC